MKGIEPSHRLKFNARRSVRKLEPVDLKDVYVDVAPDKILVFDPYLRDKPHLNQVFVKRFVDPRTIFGRRGSISDRRIVCVNTSGVESYLRRRSESTESRLPQATRNQSSMASLTV